MVWSHDSLFTLTKQEDVIVNEVKIGVFSPQGVILSIESLKGLEIMPPKRKRQRDTETIENDTPQSDKQGEHHAKKPKFAMLMSRTRHIDEQTIKSKWTTLSESAQDKVKELFLSVELPVITRHRDEKKRIEAQSALETVRKNLSKRLPKMPFPPNTRDASFNYEAALNENGLLERQLATMTGSVRLLQAEIRREETELARDKAKLEELERNAKAAEGERKRLRKNVHPVLKRLDDSPDYQTPRDASFELKPESSKETGLLIDIDADTKLFSIVKQLRSHLESMQANTSQVSGIGDAISRAGAALDRLPLG
ncbi:hypothetical protein FQN57_005105 [Myotisia sp. PD_48]|nr:hypothetical protein FQN57_005105 [Myotisia sp. PD_48]